MYFKLKRFDKIFNVNSDNRAVMSFQNEELLPRFVQNKHYCSVVSYHTASLDTKRSLIMLDTTKTRVKFETIAFVLICNNKHIVKYAINISYMIFRMFPPHHAGVNDFFRCVRPIQHKASKSLTITMINTIFIGRQ